MVGRSSRPTHTRQTIGSLKTYFTRFRLPTIERRRLIANHALNDIALTIIRQPENPSPHFQAAYYVYKHKIRHTITNIKSSLKKQNRLTISQTVFA